MENLPTAAEFFDKGNFNNVTDMLIEFAELHVEAALKDVEEQLNNALDDHLMLEENICEVIGNINNYSLENVK
jgi:hypothetical protein